MRNRVFGLICLLGTCAALTLGGYASSAGSETRTDEPSYNQTQPRDGDTEAKRHKFLPPNFAAPRIKTRPVNCKIPL